MYSKLMYIENNLNILKSVYVEHQINSHDKHVTSTSSTVIQM